MQQPRLLVAVGGFLVLLSVGGFFLFDTLMKFSGLDINILVSVGAAFLVGVASLMYGYLKGGLSPSVASDTSPAEGALATLASKV